MESELSEIIGRKADLRTAEDLSPYFRDQVVREAYLLYELHSAILKIMESES